MTLSKIWQNFIYSGYSATDTPKESLKELFFINTFSILGFLSVTIFGTLHVLEGNYQAGYAELLGSMIFFLNVVLLPILKRIWYAKFVLLSTQGVLLLVMLITGGIVRTGIFWYFTFPPTAFFLTGKRQGILSIALLYLGTLIFLILKLSGFIYLPYSFVEIRQLLVSLLVVSILIYLFENQRESSEKALRSSQEQLIAAQHISKMGSWEWDVISDKFFLSDEVFNIFKIDMKSFTPTFNGYLNYIHLDDRQKVKEHIEEAVKTKSNFAFDHRVLDFEKKVRYVHQEGDVVLGPDGQINKLLGIAQEVTERKMVEIELSNKTEELEKFNKLMVGRELKMIELKKEIKKLKSRK